MTAIWVSLGCIGAFLGLGVLAALRAGAPFVRTLVYGGCLVLCCIGLVNAATGLARAPSEIVLPLGLPWAGAHLGIDALSAFFQTIVNLCGAAVSLFALGYARHESSPERILPFFPVFVAALNLVVMAQDAFVFLLSWEFMSLSSWVLVLVDHRNPENRRSAFIYLVMASFGTLCLLLAFGLLAGPAGDFTFAALRANPPSQMAGAVILFLVLAGAGSKAGLAPLHVWLPLAHPAAPSHVSALLSGAMTKVAIYAFLRLTFDLMGAPAWWWCLAPLILGGATAVLGSLQALMQRDLKRLLAYSTIENLGVIFLGLGLALAFRANAMQTAGALALSAALLHSLNHAVMKTLLFSVSGSILSSSGTRDIERLGGLIHGMPVTGGCFLVGVAAISALPPLNGFVSEWMTFQAILQSPAIPPWTLKLLIPASGVMLALAVALAGACFVRAYGISFLGRARSPEAANAQEVDRCQLAALSILGGLCVLLGTLPGPVLDWMQPALAPYAGERLANQSMQPWLTLVPISDARASYNGLLVLLFVIVASFGAAYSAIRFSPRKPRRSDAWDCGFPDSSPLTQYSADSFAQPLRRLFGTLLLRARENVDVPQPGDNRAARFEVVTRDLIWDWLYAPIGAWIGAISGRLNELQFLTIRRYLGFVFTSLIFLLVVLALWS
jgi:formate hydrogenlyase subunit 3/multisubunit Na+/H+ antiporter MnhD subunit